MRTRTGSAAAPAQNRYSTAGFSFFQIAAIVQAVKTNEKMHCDYVTFNIRCKDKSEYFDCVAVCLPHSVNVVCEPGDAVVIRGHVRAWQRDGRISLELVAERVEEIDPARLEGGKNGTR